MRKSISHPIFEPSNENFKFLALSPSPENAQMTISNHRVLAEGAAFNKFPPTANPAGAKSSGGSAGRYPLHAGPGSRNKKDWSRMMFKTATTPSETGSVDD